MRGPQVALLRDLGTGGTALDACGQKEVHIPLIRPDAALEARERRDAAELEADIAIAAEQRKTRKLVATRNVVGPLRGGLDPPLRLVPVFEGHHQPGSPIRVDAHRLVVRPRDRARSQNDDDQPFLHRLRRISEAISANPSPRGRLAT